jgi:phospholipid/cholesterol/gamma-HCH transport system permease protein
MTMTSTPPPGGAQGGTRAKAPQPEDAHVSFADTAAKVKQGLTTGGEIAQFSMRIIRTLPDLRHHSSEVLQQTGVLILSTGLVLWLMQFVIGYQCGLEAKYVLDQIGAPLYSGVFNAWCAIREMSPYMWGYIVAAKIGCGLVAELGSMRISDEIDAIEVMGVNSMSYLVGTRVLATWIAIPFLFTVGLGVMYMAEYLVTVGMFDSVSEGGYSYIFWLYQTPIDFVYSLLKVVAMSTTVVFVGCYYGYNAHGGPVGVGKSTAKSMMLNMVLIHVIGFTGTALFWGASPNAPIAN